MSHKPSAASLRRLRREGRAIRHAVAGTHIDPDVTTRLGDRLIVELFSGTGRFARACARHGFHATTLDVADSPLQDILNDDCFAGLVASIRQKRVSFCGWRSLVLPGPEPGVLDWVRLSFEATRT